MALIVAVHGIGQQFKGDVIIHREWWPALRSGLHLAGHELEDPQALACAFYGHLFRNPEGLGGDAAGGADLGSADVELLSALWQAAAEQESDTVPRPQNEAATLGRTPALAQRALAALSRSRYFVKLTQRTLQGDLKQVTGYMNDAGLRARIQATVAPCITDETRVVIGHSLGSVVAYEALCANSRNVVSFISLGSPLGIRNLIFDKLTPRPVGGVGRWPGSIRHWSNIAESGDVVALQKQLAACFGDRVKDVLVANGSDAHHGERYLTTVQAGQAIGEGLWPNAS